MSPRRVDPRDDAGIALVVSLLVMGVMLILGLTMLSVADTQTRESGIERVRESSFNLAEGALEQQSVVLGGKGWPRAGGPVPPSTCTPTSTSPLCPSPTALVPATGTGAYGGPDYAQGASWTTRVRDNVAVRDQTWTDAVDAQPTWDSNGDGYVWVRSSATVAGRTRSIVALLRRDAIPILLPKAALVAGGLVVGQNGQSPVVSTDGTNPPVLRCPGYGPGCAEYIQSGGRKAAQIAPDTVSYDPPGLPDRFVPQDTVAKLVDSATVHTTCPTAEQAQGVVVIDVPEATTCTFTGNGTLNSPAAPGTIIMRRGTLSFAGNGQFHGLLLHLNDAGRIASPTTAACIRITGTFDVYGGVIVEGRCGLFLQGNARLTFAPNNLNLWLTGVAGIVQSTWRELTG